MSSSFVGGGQTSGGSGGAVDQVHYFQFTFLLHIQNRFRNKLRITLGANCCGSKVKGVYSSPLWTPSSIQNCFSLQCEHVVSNENVRFKPNPSCHLLLVD